MFRKLLLVSLAAPAIAVAQTASLVPTDSMRPISLSEAVSLAQRNSPAAVQARGQLRTSASAIRSAYGAFIPSLSMSMGQTKQGGQRFDPLRGPVTQSASPWQYSLGFSSGLEVFDGGRRFAQLRAARADEDAAEANDVSQRFNIALQVKREYANVLAARESESAARAQLEQAEAQLRASVARVQAGAATMSDSLRSVIQVGNARLALLTAQNNLRVASASLTRLVATPFLVTANPADTLERVTFNADSLMLVELAQRGPAVVQAERNMAAASADEWAAKTAYLPTVNLSFSYNGNRQDSSYVLTFGPYAYGRQFSVRLNYPLFNNFNREDQVLRARVAEDNAAAALRDARLAAQQSIIQQFGVLRTAEERIRIQQASVLAAEEDLRVMQQRYALGASTLLDLLTSQSQLNQARAALIQARQDYRIARAQIEAIVGRDLP
ncbi:MAG TPA: TolC family protein [Gemmatimonadaceae bacterium]|nr:TolC family protein [Gemmatimonadaceae bacterium]